MPAVFLTAATTATTDRKTGGLRLALQQGTDMACGRPDDWGSWYVFCDICGARWHASEGQCPCVDSAEAEQAEGDDSDDDDDDADADEQAE